MLLGEKKKGFSAIDIMVPSFVVDGADLHDSITKQALDSKRHILVEKPVTVEVETAVKLGEYKSAVSPETVRHNTCTTFYLANT